MGWAARARVGLWQRTQQAVRRQHLTYRLMPKILLWQLMHVVVALVCFPYRLIRHLWRNHAAQEGKLTQDRG